MSGAQSAAARTTGPGTGRVEAFSDGVFAIAITLLVLEIRVPEGDEGRLWNDLLAIWPSYAAYAISFLTIGVMWLHHHHLMGFLATIDRGLLNCNLALLAMVGFLPFPTALLARYAAATDSADQRAAVAAYGFSMILLSAAFTLLWDRVDRHQALHTADADTATIKTSRNRSFVAIAWYAAGTAVAVVAPVVSLAAFALIAITFATHNDKPPGTVTHEDATPG